MSSEKALHAGQVVYVIWDSPVHRGGYWAWMADETPVRVLHMLRPDEDGPRAEVEIWEDQRACDLFPTHAAALREATRRTEAAARDFHESERGRDCRCNGRWWMECPPREEEPAHV